MALSLSTLAVKVTATIGPFLSSMSKVEDRLKGLKKVAGAESGLGMLGSTLLGTGAAAGVVLALRAVEQGAKKAGELAAQLNAGKINAADFAAEIVKSVPVMGDAYRATEAVVVLFWEGASAAAKWAGANEEMVRWLRSGTAKLAEFETAIKQMSAGGDKLKDLRDALALESATGDDRQIEAFNQQQQAASNALEDFIKKNELAVGVAQALRDTLYDINRIKFENLNKELFDAKKKQEAEEYAAAMSKILDPLIEQAGKREELIAGLEKEVKTLGMSSNELRLYELRQLKASEADIERAKRLTDVLDAAAKARQVADIGKQIDAFEAQRASVATGPIASPGSANSMRFGLGGAGTAGSVFNRQLETQERIAKEIRALREEQRRLGGGAVFS